MIKSLQKLPLTIPELVHVSPTQGSDGLLYAGDSFLCTCIMCIITMYLICVPWRQCMCMKLHTKADQLVSIPSQCHGQEPHCVLVLLLFSCPNPLE